MSYCVNCGVELADSEKHCPLCNVEVINPDKPWTPPEHSPYSHHFDTLAKRIDRRYFTVLASLILMIPLLVTVLCDMLTGRGITWSAYVVGALLLLYVFAVLPFNFKKYHVMIFLPLDFVAVIFYLFLIERASGGNWFYGVGLPIALTAAIEAVALTLLFKKLKNALLLKAGLCLVAAGVLCAAIEFILSLHFKKTVIFAWSFYAVIPCLVLGLAALVLEHRKNFKEAIRRKLFY